METVDLASFGYLGLLHSFDDLKPWTRLSTGRPAAAEDDDCLENLLASRLAALFGCEAATLGRSTLHVFRDLFASTTPEDSTILLDEDAYPIAQWAVECAAARGVPVRLFQHHDVEALEGMLRRTANDHRCPIVVVDGVSSRTWEPAPLAEFMMRIEERGGALVVDDTHAVGLIGGHASSLAPFGYGGGGSLAWHGIDSPDVVLVSSLSKAFGTPVAVLSGSAARVGSFRSTSFTRTHCSPPSVPELLAVERSLDVNAHHGDDLRDRLIRNILRWRSVFYEAGLASADALYPVQSVRLPNAIEPGCLDEELRARGIRALFEQGDEGARVLAVLTAAMDETEVEFGARSMLEALEAVAARSFGSSAPSAQARGN